MRYQPYSVIHPRAIKTLILGSLLGLSLSIASMYVPTKTELLSPLASNEFIQVHAIRPPLYIGKVSYYSHDECIGCNSGQIMGNGQPFDENMPTLAIPCEDVKTKKNPNGIKYGTKVTVRNQDTGSYAYATITDCGGFSKYGRVADLSQGLMADIEAVTDKTTVVIQYRDRGNE